MTTNLLICAGDIPFFSETLTTTHVSSTERGIKNIVSGSRRDRFELATATADDLIIDCDLGSGASQSVNYIALMRARLLQAKGVSGYRLRGARHPFSGAVGAVRPTVMYDPNREVTLTTDRRISQIDDLENSNNGSQSTNANRPYLSRSDNLENLLLYSEQFNNAVWSKFQSSISANSVTAPDGLLVADALVENSATSAHSVSVLMTGFIAGSTYRFSWYVKEKERYRFRILVDNAGAFSTTGILSGNAQAGTIVSSSNLNSPTVTSIGDGWYKYSCERTATASGNSYFQLDMQNDSGTTSYLGNGTSGIYLFGAQFHNSSADSTYIATTDYPQIAGINGNKAVVFDDSNDSFTTTLAVNQTGGLSALVVVKPNSNSGVDALLSARNVSANDRFNWWSTAGGAMEFNINNGNAAQIGRTAPVGSMTASTLQLFFGTYNGGTLASDIKIYKSLVQIDTVNNNTGVYTVPTAGNNLAIGASNSGSLFNGGMLLVLFWQGVAISDADRTAWTEWATDYSINTAISSADQFQDQILVGGNDEDWIDTFTASSAYRYWWLQFTTNAETASKYPISKAMFGNAIDMGKEPARPYSLSRNKEEKGERFSKHEVTFNWTNISDAIKSRFYNELAKYRDVLTTILIDSNDYALFGKSCLHTKLVDTNITPKIGNQYDIEATFKEEI